MRCPIFHLSNDRCAHRQQLFIGPYRLQIRSVVNIFAASIL